MNDDGVENRYYHLTASEAEKRAELIQEASGVAVLKPYDNNGVQTFQLISYKLDDKLDE